MGHYPTGVAVVTGRAADGELLAMVVGTFSSVSLDPPLVSFMPMKASKTFGKMQECSSLCINIFGGEQESEMLSIAQRWQNKLDGIEWYPSPAGDPILKNSIAWIDTTISETIEAGDHWIVLCRVHDLEVTNSVAPLLFFQGGYGSFVGSTMMGRLRHDSLPAIHAAHSADDDLESLAESIGCEVIVYAALSEDEFATVYSALGPGVSPEHRFASRVPIVPPIGDTYLFDKPEEVRERWLGKLGTPSDDVRRNHCRRLEMLNDKGYVISHLPEEGSVAYEQMIEATKEYLKGPLTPFAERTIRELIGSTTVDYSQREITDDERYNVGSIVFPVRDPTGEHTMTLRLAQLPQDVDGRTVRGWITQAQAVVRRIENH
ncbi:MULTISPECIES: flavin reductase family protein [unclassified Corynebacterium]|uniref:flavin reductase family protein n=1 Tax=unclassified Corynebacterium TaxID=2624378 RepID=UPI0030A2D1F6